MEIREYNYLADDAMLVRKTVFIEEQGFKDEFDDIDKIATHLVAYDNGKPIAVCRFFRSDERKSYLLGRLAVIKDYRKKQLGAAMMKKAEELVKAKNGTAIELHASRDIPFAVKWNTRSIARITGCERKSHPLKAKNNFDIK